MAAQERYNPQLGVLHSALMLVVLVSTPIEECILLA